MSKRTGRILLVDDDPNLLKLLRLRLEAAGHAVKAVASGADALTALETFRPELVIADLRMEPVDGMSLLKELRQRHPGLAIILLTAYGTIPEAVEATQTGAFTFLSKPYDKRELFDHIDQALSVAGTPESDASWRAGILTRSERMEELLEEARRVAQAEANVLIVGESGTGKELLAHTVHRASPRAAQPFIALNCAALPEELLESELFGHEKGAFTGASHKHPGLFRAAHRGTVFLDEIGDMPAALQAKLLRVLEDGQVRPVGSTSYHAVDVRVVAATHRDLGQLIAAGDFREDLYYRLNVVQLSLPPLHARREDIPLLVHHFLEELAAKTETPTKVYAPEAMELLVAADWPGNVRQLRNVVEQNVALSPTPVIDAHQVRHALGDPRIQLLSLDEARAEFTRDYLVQLLYMTQGNVSRAAGYAQRNRTDFYNLLARHQLNPDDFRANREPQYPEPTRGESTESAE